MGSFNYIYYPISYLATTHSNPTAAAAAAAAAASGSVERSRTPTAKDCRVVGVGTFSGIAGYALYLRQFRFPTTDKSQKLFLALLSLSELRGLHS